ncbi:hypothetical protein EDD11_005637, partial [Mortierella claussenii]
QQQQQPPEETEKAEPIMIVVPKDANSRKGKRDTTQTAKGQKRQANAFHQSRDSNKDSEVNPKRARKASKAMQIEEFEEEGERDGAVKDSLWLTSPEDPPINWSDPCLLFPTEVWHQILSHLPLSQVAKIAGMSKAWLDGSRSFPLWRTICERHKLGQPKIKYRSHMALVCSRSFWICDQCHSYTTGRGNASEIPLPVHRQDDYEVIWNLCHHCRLVYYRRFHEPLREIEDDYEWQANKITKTDACCTYHLSDDDLCGIYFEERCNPHYRSGYPMRLYNKYAIQKRALRVHAGWVGIDAFTDSICRKRRAAFKMREQNFKIRTFQPGSRGEKHNSDASSHSQNHIGSSSQEQDINTEPCSTQQSQCPLVVIKQEVRPKIEQEERHPICQGEARSTLEQKTFTPAEILEAIINGKKVGEGQVVKTENSASLPELPTSAGMPYSVSSFVPLVPIACE